jgi:hypothetical protein
LFGIRNAQIENDLYRILVVNDPDGTVKSIEIECVESDGQVELGREDIINYENSAAIEKLATAICVPDSMYDGLVNALEWHVTLRKLLLHRSSLTQADARRAGIFEPDKAPPASPIDALEEALLVYELIEEEDQGDEKGKLAMIALPYIESDLRDHAHVPNLYLKMSEQVDTGSGSLIFESIQSVLYRWYNNELETGNMYELSREYPATVVYSKPGQVRFTEFGNYNMVQVQVWFHPQVTGEIVDAQNEFFDRKSDDCPICLDPFEKVDEQTQLIPPNKTRLPPKGTPALGVLPCGHGFHVECIRRIQHRCPTCRAIFNSESVSI